MPAIRAVAALVAIPAAQSVHTNAAIPAYSFHPSSHIRGRAWVQVPFGSALSNANNLSSSCCTLHKKLFLLVSGQIGVPPDLKLYNTLAGLRPIALGACM